VFRKEGSDNARAVRIKNFRRRSEKAFRGSGFIEVDYLAETFAIRNPFTCGRIESLRRARGHQQVGRSEYTPELPWAVPVNSQIGQTFGSDFLIVRAAARMSSHVFGCQSLGRPAFWKMVLSKRRAFVLSPWLM
jgi:hypothetical protein